MSADANLNEQQFGYRMQHQGPDADSGEALHEIGSGAVYPPDVHDNLKAYNGNVDLHPDTMRAIRRSRGNPDQVVHIYRAVPRGVREVNPGDWVATSGAYARQESRVSADPSKDMPVIHTWAKASELRNEGNSLEEWSYHGEQQKNVAIRHRGGKNAESI